VVKLTKVYRSDTAILEAAAALREGDSETLKKLLEEDEGAVRLYPPGSPDSMARLIAREFRESAARGAQPVQFSDDENTEGIPDEIRGLFDDFSSRAVLSPLRRGEWGVPAMNERISRLLGGTASPFPGMPVMITRNDPERKLWNGDRGILVSIDGKLRAAFPEAGGARSFPLAALPGWEPAWVQTIHKSQGSEFDSVTVLLPRGAERLLSREILYTAFTRARHTVNLHAEFETVEAALERRVVRHSRIRNWAAGG
jgi:exodeoxyribonuclease V alpha subunit